MKKRRMKGIPKIIVVFRDGDPNRFAPLHRRLGIETHVHRQAILLDLIPGARGTKSTGGWDYDPINRVWSNNHLYRASITLAGSA